MQNYFLNTMSAKRVLLRSPVMLLSSMPKCSLQGDNPKALKVLKEERLHPYCPTDVNMDVDPCQHLFLLPTRGKQSAEEAERVRTPLFVPLPVVGLVWETDPEGGISGRG